MGPVYDLFKILFDHSHPPSTFSYRKLNATLRKGLLLAIESEMRFEKDDIKKIYEDFSGVFWFGTDGEDLFTAACIAGNRTAASSFLAWKGRKRFVWPRKKSVGITQKFESKLDLLHFNRVFTWNDELVRVTSFNDEEGTVTVCSYRSSMADYNAKILHRYTLVPGDLKAALQAEA